MESAELNLDTYTEIDQILLETEGTSVSFVALNQTDKNGLDAGGTIVNEENTFGGSFQKNEVITGSASGATSTILVQSSTKKIHSVVLFKRMKSLQVQRLALLQQFLQKIQQIVLDFLFQLTMPGLQEKL